MSFESEILQFIATESPLKLMKNAFYFTSKALFVLKIINNADTDIAQYLEK